MPPRLPITDEERRERKRQQDYNAHIRRMERFGFRPRGRLIKVIDASFLRLARCRFEIKETQSCV